jgi:hypothetical protein
MAESEEIKKIKKQLEDLKKSLDDVSKRSIDRILKSFTEGGASLNEWRQQLEFFQDEADSVSDSLNYISKSLSASVSELRQGNEELRKQVNATKKLSSIADQLLAIRKGDASFDKKKIEKLKDEAKLRLQILESAQKTNTFGSASYLALQNDIDAANELLDAFEGIESTSEKINKELGVLPSIAGGIDKALSKIGLPSLGIADAIDETQRLGQEAARAGDDFKPMSTFLGKIGENFSSILTKANLIQGVLVLLTDALFKSDKGAGEMAKNMNLTYSDALATRRELGNIAALSGDAALNTKGLQETYMAIGQSLGSNAKLNEKDLITATKLREQAGYTNEQLAELNKLSAINGKSIEQNTKEILGGAKAYASRKGLVINEKQVLEDVTKASASLKLSLNGSADALAKSAVQARAVGLNLEQAAAMADSLLNFETSIENELSAELLTGKNLNFEKARTLALNNDIAGAAEEVANQVGTSADFAKMNAIQQEAIAKAAGLTKDQLAQSLMDREALAKLSGVEGKDAKEKFDNLVKQVGLEEAKKRLGNDQLANQYQQQSVQERFNQSVEKLQEIFVQVAEPILAIVSPLMNLVSTVLPAINFLLQPLIQGFQLIGDIVGVISSGISSFTGWLAQGSAAATALKVVLAPIAAIVGVIAAGMIYASLAAIPVVGPTLGAIAVVGMISMLAKAASSAMSGTKQGNDIMSPGTSGGGYGSRTLFGPEGAIQLNNKDTVIAGTNLFDKDPEKANDMMSGPSGNITPGPITVANSTTPTTPPPDSNALLIAEMKRGNDQREEQIKLQKQNTFVSTIRVQ